MPHNPQTRHRQSIRLPEYDYSLPRYDFVTICSKDKQIMFGDIVNEKMVLNNLGKIVKQCWIEIPTHYPNVELDAYQIMPNHLHGIIEILDEYMIRCKYRDSVGAGLAPAHWSRVGARAGVNPAPTPISTKSKPILGKIIGEFKSRTFQKYRQYAHQNNLYNHIVLKFW